MPHGADGDRAQQLILGVIERLRRRHHDRIAGVDAHGIDVLHVAYRDAVVAGVAHHLVLDLFPSLEAFLDQYLGDTACESAPQRRFDLRLEPHDAAALSAEGVAAAQHDRQPDLADRAPRCVGRIAGTAAGGIDADLGQALDEQAPILRVAYGLDRRAEHLDAVLRKHARIVQRETAVQRRLAAKRKRDGVHRFLGDDFLDQLRGHSGEIDAIGKPLARLDRRDVRIDQNGSDAFLAQRLDRLGTGVVKLARLSDLQRAGAEHHRPARLSRQINAVHDQRCAMEATRRRKSSKRNPVSCGPGLASGWNWTLK